MLGLRRQSARLRSLPARLAFFPCSVIALAGCASGHPAFGQQLDPPVAMRPQAEAVPVARMQKPELANGTIHQTIFTATNEPFPDSPADQVSARIRAEVNGYPILDEDVRQACLPLLRAAPTEEKKVEIFRKQLEDLIDEEVVLQDLNARMEKRPQVLKKLKEAAGKEFDKQLRYMKSHATPPIKTDDQLKSAFAAQGMSFEYFRRRSERKFMAQEYVRNRIWPHIEQIGHQQIVDYYEEHTSEFQAQDGVEWQDIFIDASRYPSRAEARKFAEQLVARARAGEDFAKLAIKYDNGISAYNKGEGIGRKRGEIKPLEAETVLFQLKDGDIGPIIELGNGFHVVRLVHRDYAGRMPLNEKVQSEIRKRLQNETYDREMKRFLADLKRKSSIEIAAE